MSACPLLEYVSKWGRLPGEQVPRARELLSRGTGRGGAHSVLLINCSLTDVAPITDCSHMHARPAVWHVWGLSGVHPARYPHSLTTWAISVL